MTYLNHIEYKGSVGILFFRYILARNDWSLKGAY